MSSFTIRIALGLLVAVSLVGSANAAPTGAALVGSTFHPYHVSLAEMERNERTGNFEVSLCIWPADLEKALTRMTQKPVDLDKVDDLDELIAKYIDSKIVFTSGDTRAKIRYVGCELDLQKGWLYFEVQTGKELDDWSYQNRFFFELNEDQINHFNFKSESNIQSDACTLKKPEIELN